MGSGIQDCYMQAPSAGTPSYFTNKSLQAYRHSPAAGESSLSSISSSPQLSVFSVAPQCHPDPRESPLDIQIPVLSVRPSRPCCLFAAPHTTSHPSASCTFYSFATSLSHFTPHHWSLLPELTSPQFCLRLDSPPCRASLHKPSSLSTVCLPQPLFLTSHSPFLTLPYPQLLRSLRFQRPH